MKKFPQAVFVCLASTFGAAFLITWFLGTGSKFYSNPNALVSMLTSLQSTLTRIKLHKRRETQTRTSVLKRRARAMNEFPSCRLLSRCLVRS